MRLIEHPSKLALVTVPHPKKDLPVGTVRSIFKQAGLRFKKGWAMLFSIAIHQDKGTAYGVIVPDVPGCFSYGDTIEEAISNAKEAVVGHIETLLELGEPVSFQASTIEGLKLQEAFKDAAWGFVEVDFTELDSKPER